MPRVRGGRARRCAKCDSTRCRPATQQLLAPFLASPDVSGVPARSGAVRLRRPPAAAAEGCRRRLDSARGLGRQVGRRPSEVAIYWDDSVPLGGIQRAGRPTALPLKSMNVIWPKLTSGSIGRPPPGQPLRQDLRGIHDARRRMRTTSCATSEDLHGQSRALHIAPAASRRSSTCWAHEVDACPSVLPLSGAGRRLQPELGSTSWMHEATAKWSEHYVYPDDDRQPRSTRRRRGSLNVPTCSSGVTIG